MTTTTSVTTTVAAAEAGVIFVGPSFFLLLFFLSFSVFFYQGVEINTHRLSILTLPIRVSSVPQLVTAASLEAEAPHTHTPLRPLTLPSHPPTHSIPPPPPPPPPVLLLPLSARDRT